MGWYLLGDKVRKVGASIQTRSGANDEFIDYVNNHESTRDVVMASGLPKRPLYITVKKYNKKESRIEVEVAYQVRVESTSSSPYFYADIEYKYDPNLMCHSK